MKMKAFEEPSYETSIPIADRELLLKALDRAGHEKRIVKIPVMVNLSPPIGIRAWHEVYIGTSSDMAVEDKILLHLNDAALGVSFADRLHQYCPQGDWCKLWLVGYWAEDLPVIHSDPEPSKFPFSIRAVLGPQADGDKPMAYVAVKSS